MNWFKCLFIICTGLQSTLAIAASTDFDKANLAYENQEFEEATKIYQTLIDEGNQSVNLYYNAGNAYFKINEIGKSILYFEKAQKLAPRNTDIAHNLKIAYSYTKDQIEPLPRLFFVNWWHALLNYTTASRWAIFGIIGLWLAVLTAISFLFYKRKGLNYFSIVSFAIAMFLLFIAYQKNNYNTKSNEAIILETDVILRSAPNENAEELGTVHEGLKVSIKDGVDLWYQIQLEDGNKVWVTKQSLALI